jgi:chloramphenicol-sensitive protein RarD
MNKGILYGLVAFVTWGLFPIYWKWLKAVPVLQLLAHRIGWSFVLLLLVIFATRSWEKFRAVALERRALRVYFVAALLIAVN